VVAGRSVRDTGADLSTPMAMTTTGRGDRSQQWRGRRRTEAALILGHDAVVPLRDVGATSIRERRIPVSANPATRAIAISNIQNIGKRIGGHGSCCQARLAHIERSVCITQDIGKATDTTRNPATLATIMNDAPATSARARARRRSASKN
jgi:hypothetical protein